MKKLRPVSFNWRKIANPHESIGLIAQEVQRVIREVVYTDDEHLSISYIDLIAVLINAVKELDAKMEAVLAAQTQ